MSLLKRNYFHYMMHMINMPLSETIHGENMMSEEQYGVIKAL